MELDYLEWLESEWAPQPPPPIAETVRYVGPIAAVHGLWVVSAYLDDGYLTLEHPAKRWARLNTRLEHVERLDSLPDKA